MLDGTQTTARLSGLALAVAIVVLVVFGAFVFFMIVNVKAEEVTWTRLGWLFGSVEAVAFGAAGAIFGNTIQRAQTEKAEQRADKNEKDAGNGRVLAIALKTTAPASPDRERFGPSAAPDALLAQHAALADRLFPDA